MNMYEIQMLHSPSPFEMLLNHLDIPNNISATIAMLIVLCMLARALNKYYKI